ncbi:MAG: hypothetical protein MRY21_01300 [Simkaniaceae bacterium]|nr:hypothetical protein [Simkaniaceae bacterium]
MEVKGSGNSNFSSDSTPVNIAPIEELQNWILKDSPGFGVTYLSLFQNLMQTPVPNPMVVGAMEEFTQLPKPSFLNVSNNNLTGQQGLAGGFYNLLQGIAHVVLSLNTLVQDKVLSNTPPAKGAPPNGYEILINTLNTFNMVGANPLLDFYNNCINDTYSVDGELYRTYLGLGITKPSDCSYQNMVPNQGNWQSQETCLKSILNSNDGISVQDADPARLIYESMGSISNIYNSKILGGKIDSDPNVQGLLNNIGSVIYNAQEMMTCSGW